MLHLVFGMNFQIQFIKRITSHNIFIFLLKHLSSHLYHHQYSQHQLLPHSFTPAQNYLYNKIHEGTHWIIGLNRTWVYHAHFFCKSFFLYSYRIVRVSRHIVRVSRQGTSCQ